MKKLLQKIILPGISLTKDGEKLCQNIEIRLKSAKSIKAKISFEKL